MAERDWRRDYGRDREWGEDEEERWRGRGPQRSERSREWQYGRDRGGYDEDRNRRYGEYSERDRDDEYQQRRDREPGWSSSGWGDDRNRSNQQNRPYGRYQESYPQQPGQSDWQRSDRQRSDWQRGGSDWQRGGDSQRDQDRQRAFQTQPYDTTWSYYEFWLTPGPHSGRGPQGYQRNAERLREDVCDRLEAHGQIDASQIQVQANEQGEITLTGAVSSRHEKRLADDIAESVRGVKDVHNQLKVRREGSATGEQSGAMGRAKS
jgi:hypothetical protein